MNRFINQNFVQLSILHTFRQVKGQTAIRQVFIFAQETFLEVFSMNYLIEILFSIEYYTKVGLQSHT